MIAGTKPFQRHNIRKADSTHEKIIPMFLHTAKKKYRARHTYVLVPFFYVYISGGFFEPEFSVTSLASGLFWPASVSMICALDKLMHFFPQLSDFVALKNGLYIYILSSSGWGKIKL